MASQLRTHHAWEDWLGIVIGVLIGVCPWLTGQTDSQSIVWNAVILGLIVIALGFLELTALQRWEEIAGMLCGLWAILSPFVFDYASTALAVWHFGLGALLVLLALLQLWQDWHRTDIEMAR